MLFAQTRRFGAPKQGDSAAAVAPSQGRGSKHVGCDANDECFKSPHHRGADRNLQTMPGINLQTMPGIDNLRRRPITGARIETCCAARCSWSRWVAPSQGRGSKPCVRRAIAGRAGSSHHRGADRNSDRDAWLMPARPSPHHRGADRNVTLPIDEIAGEGRPITRPARIETRSATTSTTRPRVAPSQGRGSKLATGNFVLADL